MFRMTCPDHARPFIGIPIKLLQTHQGCWLSHVCEVESRKTRPYSRLRYTVLAVQFTVQCTVYMYVVRVCTACRLPNCAAPGRAHYANSLESRLGLSRLAFSRAGQTNGSCIKPCSIGDDPDQCTHTQLTTDYPHYGMHVGTPFALA